MTRVLYRRGVVHAPERPDATALILDGGTVAWVGRDGDAPADVAVDEVVDLGGALVTPAFVDTHVHVTATGLALDGLDLTGCPSLAEALQRLAEHAAARPAEILIGHGWDETRWPERRAPTAAELDGATGGGVCYLSRTDAHSATVSTAMLARVPEARAEAGFDPSGYVRLDAHHTIRRYAFDSMSPEQRRRVQRRTLDEAARRGIGCLHENAMPGLSSEEDLASLLGLARDAEPCPEVVGYWGELGAVKVARRHGLAGLAGDLLADGSLGSHTACLSSPYRDDPETGGHAYLSVEQVTEHVLECTRHGLQAGFHAIGDGALRTVLTGFQEAADRIGADQVRAARHRLEHVEMLDSGMIATMARLGIAASVQPIADTFWGGADGMYERRLGAERARAMNPFRDLLDAGVPLALSSDSPIMPMNPWLAIRAAVDHHVPEQRISVTEAFTAHTAGGWRAAGRDGGGAGHLVPGAPAGVAVWDCGDTLDPATRLPAVGAEAPQCLRTVVRGRVVHDEM